jgi:RNA polymerase sigma-70 factor, ECF subfamily
MLRARHTSVWRARELFGQATRGTNVTPEEQLMTSLHSEHYDVLMSFVLGYVRSRDHAEDIVQETMLRAWRNIEKIRPDNAAVRSYLFAIARNVLTDAWRAERRRPVMVHDDAAIAAVPSLDDVESALEGQLVVAALGRLSGEHREVIQALYYDGLSVPEAAARLRLPQGTVKSRAYYAVRNLRTAFEEMGVLR